MNRQRAGAADEKPEPAPVAAELSLSTFVLVTLIGGCLVWMVSVMGAAPCMAAEEPVTWACTTTGQATIAWIVPIGSLTGWTFLATARKYAIHRPWSALIVATMIIVGSWYLSIVLAMSSAG